MGLDCSHGAWHSSYTAFRFWREKIAEVAGLPPLELMEGFYVSIHSGNPPTFYHGIHTLDKETIDCWCINKIDSRLPIKWEALKPDPLHELLNHSDCDGEIAPENCGAIANSLERLIPLLPDEDCPGYAGSWKDATQRFIDGLRLAASLNEFLKFG